MKTEMSAVTRTARTCPTARLCRACLAVVVRAPPFFFNLEMVSFMVRWTTPDRPMTLTTFVTVTLLTFSGPLTKVKRPLVAKRCRGLVTTLVCAMFSSEVTVVGLTSLVSEFISGMMRN